LFLETTRDESFDLLSFFINLSNDDIDRYFNVLFEDCKTLNNYMRSKIPRLVHDSMHAFAEYIAPLTQANSSENTTFSMNINKCNSVIAIVIGEALRGIGISEPTKVILGRLPEKYIHSKDVEYSSKWESAKELLNQNNLLKVIHDYSESLYKESTSDSYVLAPSIIMIMTSISVCIFNLF
jgi:hypothetical protein